MSSVMLRLLHNLTYFRQQNKKSEWVCCTVIKKYGGNHKNT